MKKVILFFALVMSLNAESFSDVTKALEKEDYKKAYDKIMKKFKDDKTQIFKNLDDFKSKSPMKSN